MACKPNGVSNRLSVSLFAPGKAARTVVPSLHPITLPLPADMLLLNVVTPTAFPLLKLR